jgi:hypothetical protein
VAACGGHSSSSIDGSAGSDAALIDGAIVDGPADAAPVIPTPDECPQGDECGSAASCVSGTCVCDDGYRACEGGCCPVDLETVTLDNAWGDDVRMQYAPDGTAYILVDQRIGTTTDYKLVLYKREPAGSIVDAGWSVPLDYYKGMFDFAIRGDGTLMIAYAPAYGEGSPIELVTWKDGVASEPVQIGSGFGYDIGVSTGLDGDDTLWVTWSSSRSGGLSAYSLDTSGTHRIYSLGSNGTVEETDVEYDATQASVFSFYGHRYTGMFVTGNDRLSGTGTLASTCAADDAVFDSAGHLWTVYNTYSSIETYACRDGESIAARDARFGGSQTRPFNQAQIALDGHDTAYLASYDAATYTATWWASTTNHGWSHGTIPTHYGVPDGWNQPAQAHPALARDPQGRISIVVLPQDPGMGPMVLATFR